MGASFIVENFEQLIQEQGYNINWSQAIVCECYENGQPDIHCPLCLGSGYRYLPYKKIKGVTTSLSGKLEVKIQGLNEQGTAYITPQLGVIMGYQDRLEFTDIECKFSQAITMGDKKTSSTYREIRKVLFVIVEDSVFEEGKDFKIAKDRFHLEWICSENQPAKGSKISILYLTTPTYLVNDMVHELRSTRENRGTRVPYTVELPKQYLIKRENFIYGKNVNEKREDVGIVEEGLSYE